MFQADPMRTRFSVIRIDTVSRQHQSPLEQLDIRPKQLPCPPAGGRSVDRFLAHEFTLIC